MLKPPTSLFFWVFMFHFFQLHPQSWIYWMTYRFFALTPRWITPSSCRNRMVSFSLHPCGSNPAGTKTPVLMFFSSDGSHNHVWSTNMYNKHHQTSMVSSGPSKVLLPLFFRGILVVQVAKEEFGPDLASNAISLSLSRCRQVPCVWRILILEIVQSQQMLVFRRYIGLLQRRWWRIRRWRLTVLILIVIVDHSDDAFRDALLYQRDALQGRKPLRTWSSGSTHQRKVGDQLGPSICEDVKIKLFCQVWMFFYVYIVCSLRVHKGGFRLGFFWDSAACPQNVFFHSFSFQPFPSCGSNMFQC